MNNLTKKKKSKCLKEKNIEEKPQTQRKGDLKMLGLEQAIRLREQPVYTEEQRAQGEMYLHQKIKWKD